MFGPDETTPFHRRSADGFEYWGDLEDRQAQHRRHARNLLIVIALLALLAVVVDPVMLGFGLVLSPLLLFELWMVRRSRTGSRIPDYRPADPVEIELDDT